MLTLLLIGWLLYSLWKWLSLKTESDIEKKGFFWEELGLLLRYLFLEIKTFLHKFFIDKIFYNRKNDNIYIVFKRLCHWGKQSGLPRKKFQTPSEYGRYLSLFFPDSLKDIGLIIDGFNREFYGKKVSEKDEIENMKKAWRRLSSLSQWPLRLKIKIFHSRRLDYRKTVSSHS
jgi:hypothetical protein